MAIPIEFPRGPADIAVESIKPLLPKSAQKDLLRGDWGHVLTALLEDAGVVNPQYRSELSPVTPFLKRILEEPAPQWPRKP